MSGDDSKNITRSRAWCIISPRISPTVCAWKENAQGVRTYFLYDGDKLVAEFDSSGTMTASQVWGAEGLAYRRTTSGASAGNRFYSWDVRGNIAATTDSAGAVLNTPSSDGFSTQGGSEPCATFGGQVGGYLDSETGLILFGQRYYDSALGSWLTRDPIAEAGGINLYSYVQGNPVNRVDPSGLKPGDPFSKQDDAAIDVLKGINPRSIKYNKEYIGFIYKKKYKGKFYYYATPPKPGSGTDSEISNAEIPSKSVRVGDYHTHGDYSIEGKDSRPYRTKYPSKDMYNSNNFSDQGEDSDKAGVLKDAKGIPGYRGYIGTPSGKFKSMDGKGNVKTIFPCPKK